MLQEKKKKLMAVNGSKPAFLDVSLVLWLLDMKFYEIHWKTLEYHINIMVYEYDNLSVP